MAQGLSTLALVSAYIAKIYEDALFVAQESTIMGGLVTPYSAQGWMTRNIMKYPASPTAQVVAEGVDYANPQQLTKTAVPIDPYEVMVQSILTDRRIDTDPDGARADHATWLGQGIAYKIDTDVAALLSSLTNEQGPGAGSAMDLQSIANAMAVLRVNMKQPAQIYVVLHPYQWLDIWTELGQPSANQAFLGDVANEALRNRFVGSWLGALWFECGNVSITGTDAVGGAFSRECLCLDTRKAPTLEPERDASLRAWELNMSAGYGCGVRRNECGVKLTSDITAPT